MKALSIRQPWATLIVLGIKKIENRSWSTDHRGDLAIHASKSGTRADMAAGRALCAELGVEFPAVEFSTGGFVGVVKMNGLVWENGGRIESDHRRSHKWGVGDLAGWDGASIGWVLENPQAVEFTPAAGRLGLFEAPGELAVKR